MNFIHKDKIKSLISVFSLLIIAVFSSCENSETQTVTTFSNLVWADEFNRLSPTDSIPDATKWTYDKGTGENGWGNNELQYYRDSTENVKLKDGMLQITALQESYMGAGYTSGRVLTRGLFETKYGRIEARIKLPFGKGYWPAFWMLGANLQDVTETPDDTTTDTWPLAGEIDIMEYLGNSPTTVFGSVHGPGYSAGEAITKDYTLENDRFDTDFHVFGIEWGENYINYYVDNVLYNQITPADVSGEWVFNKPFFIILNMAIGGDFPGSPNAETVFPQTMYIDYVRVYQ
jgi:beta-glucanase (GH16 family)